MQAIDVSKTTYYQDLTRQNVLVVDYLQDQQLDRRDGSPSGSNSVMNITISTPSGLPEPFDTSLGSNFTNPNCPNYFTKFLNNATFQSCLPISLLLQNSMSFFQTARSANLLDKTLNISCSAPLAVCSPLMSSIASQLISVDNCGSDYAQQNPLVMQAYSGLKAYEPVYQATCLKDKTTDKYCFTEAMTKSSNTDDSYPYYTAVGLALPVGSRPTCNTCLQQTMQIFSGYAVQKDQPLSQTYLNCAVQVNSGCGQTFANTQVQSTAKGASKSSGNRVSLGSSFYTIFALILLSAF